MFTSLNRMGDSLSRLGDGLLPLTSRFVFAAVLLMYYLNSGMTKLGDGVLGFLNPSVGAYAQIFPKAMEAAGYDTSALTLFHKLVVIGGTVGEFVLPVLIVVGLLTRLSALGMIAFVVLQSLTDLYGHGGIEHDGTLGAWFDRLPDALILDQRAFWVLGLLILVLKGGGWLSLDRLFFSGRAVDPADVR